MFELPDVAAHLHVGNSAAPVGRQQPRRALRAPRGAAALRHERARQRLAMFECLTHAIRALTNGTVNTRG